METHRTTARKEDGTHLMKCSCKISLIFLTDYYRTHWGEGGGALGVVVVVVGLQLHSALPALAAVPHSL